jgi:hypothetical protein
MKLQTLMLINAIVALVFGIVFALWGPAILLASGLNTMPQQFEQWFWIAGTFVRLLGVTLVGFGLIAYAGSQFCESAVRFEINLAFFVANALGFVIMLIQQLAIWPSLVGGMATVIYLILAIGFGVFLVAPRPVARLNQ